MSLVGPRPPLITEVATYESHELRRLATVPGMTGLWQVTLRGRHEFSDMVALDVEYGERLSPMLDIEILARTIPTVIFGRGSY
jgi:lipopolysaccharide/colanic/teichoic acid biosynthesis glycosyltransferase